MITMHTRLAQFRKEMKHTQASFSELLDVKTTTYASYEANTFPQRNVFVALHRMGLNLNWLISGQGEMLLNNEALNSNLQLVKEPLMEQVNHPFRHSVLELLKSADSVHIDIYVNQLPKKD